MGEKPAQPALEIAREALDAAATADSARSAEIEVVEIASADTDGPAVDGRRGRRLIPTGIAGRLTETVLSAGISGVRAVANASGRMAHRVAVSPAGRVLSDVAAGAAAAMNEDGGVDWALAGRRAEERLSRVIAVVVPVVAESIDPATIVERIDVNGLMEQVDVGRLLSRVDVDALLDRVDVDALLDRVDVDALLDRVDVDAFLDRVDVDAFLDRVDVDALLERVDIDALLERTDVAGIMQRVQVGNVLTRGTGEVAESALDLARRQSVGLDVVLSRTVNRLIGRDPDRMPTGPPRLVTHGDAETPDESP